MDNNVTGVSLIAIERTRQVSHENWTAEHDEQHEYGELARAAICYARHAVFSQYAVTPSHPKPDWPWEPEWWKPKDAISDLVKAGALIAAEIDRLERRARSREAI